MTSVRDILDAIRGLPRSDRLRLVEELTTDLESESVDCALVAPPKDSNLEVRSDFYIYTGPVEDPSILDHRVVRDERADYLARGASARRD